MGLRLMVRSATTALMGAVLLGIGWPAVAPARAADWPGWLRGTFEALYWVLPKINDVGLLAHQAVFSDIGSGGHGAGELAAIRTADPLWSIGTSLAFAAAMFALALWRFHKSDY